MELECPCCMRYIYNAYVCPVKHKVCGDCFVRLDSCPLCRAKGFEKVNPDPKGEIPRKRCPYEGEGCTLQVYEFDDEHAEDCAFKPLACPWCKNQMDSSSNEKIIAHFTSFCVIPFVKFNYEREDSKEGYPTKVEVKLYIQPQTGYILELGNKIPENQFIMVMVPRKSKGFSEVSLISSNKKYIKSNYKVKADCSDMFIGYRRLVVSTIKAFSFSLENRFLLNKNRKVYDLGNNTTFVESNYVDGEPGSAGNWTIEQYEEIVEQFSTLFSKKPGTSN